MLKLLIVDDEYVSIQAIICSLDWEKAGITTVLSASNISQAKELFDQHDIDLMLSDIEMPQGNGMELLGWVREHHPETECIFLTCHADFKYAQKAIELGSLDYLLKPVDPDSLAAAVTKAVKQITTNRQRVEQSRSGALWDKHKHFVIERFWLDILENRIISTPEEIRKAVADRNIGSDDGLTFIPVYIKVKRWHEDMDASEELRMEFALKNMANEKIMQQGNAGIVLDYNRGGFVGIIVKNNCAGYSLRSVQENCEAFVRESTKYFCCDICCYIGSECFIHTMAGEVFKLTEKDRCNVAYYNKVFLSAEMIGGTGDMTLPNMSLWLPLLGEGAKDRVIMEVVTYLNNLVRNRQADRTTLMKFQHQFIQIVYAFLKQGGIQAHELVSDHQPVDLFAYASSSVTDMITWVKYIIETSVTFSNSVKESQTVIDKAKKYIALNIAEEISREDVAKHVFLNADYLTRIFRKQTGLGVTEYIIKERMKIAKELLSNTGMSISSIAEQVGYQTSAHFARAFKKEMNLSPSEFRFTNAI